MLFDLLRTPSGFEGRPWAYARNQIGHGYLVGGLPVLMGVPIAAVLTVYAVWELVQWTRFGGALWDGIEDAAHVSLIALAASIGEAWLLLPHALFVVAGTLRRL